VICLSCPYAVLFLVEVVCLVEQVARLVEQVVLVLEIVEVDPGTAEVEGVVPGIVVEEAVLGIVEAVLGSALVEGVVPGIVEADPGTALVEVVDPGIAGVVLETAGVVPETVLGEGVGPEIGAGLGPGIVLEEVVVPVLADTVED